MALDREALESRVMDRNREGRDAAERIERRDAALGRPPQPGALVPLGQVVRLLSDPIG